VDVDRTASVAGQYWFVIETFSGDNVVVGVNLSEITAQTATNVLYSSWYSTETTLSSQTVKFVTVEEAPVSLGGASPALILGLVVITVLIVGGYVAVTRREERTKTPEVIPKEHFQERSTRLLGAPVPPATTVTKFCMICGAPLPAHAIFCNRCGSKQ
jgi:hypothetical protein